MQEELADYPHLECRRCWDLRKTGLMNVARCTTIVECLPGIPIEPATKESLRMFSFRRGAQATTAIEVPSRLRTDRRHVGRYLTPPPEHVEALLMEFCDWLRPEFGFHSGEQSLEDVIVQAIVARILANHYNDRLRSTTCTEAADPCGCQHRHHSGRPVMPDSTRDSQ